MSAPDLPRFVVASVTGFDGLGKGNTKATPPTIYFVCDSWRLYEVVGRSGHPGGRQGGAKPHEYEARAVALAAQLNAEHEAA